MYHATLKTTDSLMMTPPPPPPNKFTQALFVFDTVLIFGYGTELTHFSILTSIHSKQEYSSNIIYQVEL